MIKRYLFHTIAQIFLPFFIVLFFIASVVLLIGLATITQFIKLNIWDLGQIFLYSIPNGVFFIIPITLFCSCVLGLSRLSFDYELLVLFSLGISPRKILTPFIGLSIFASIVLLFFSLALIPLSKSAYGNFMAQKRAEININIKAGEFGQKLGDWLVYVDSAHDRYYEGLVLFSSNLESQEVFITAKQGEITNDNGVFTLLLRDGSAYFAESKKVERADFTQMLVHTKIDEINLSSYDLWAYWKSAFEENASQARRLAQAIITSLFPIVSIFLIPLFGIANPRFHKNLSYIYLLTSVAGYFIAMHILSQNIPFYGMFGLPLTWLIGSYFLYRKFVLQVY